MTQTPNVVQPVNTSGGSPEASTAASAVRVQNLVYRYGDRIALSGVSFEVPNGLIFGLLGPNGSGKTTLFSILSTLRRPQEGTAEVFGLDVMSNPADVRRLIGVAFQNPSIDGRLTSLENLQHHGHLYGMRGRSLAARCAELLERFGLAARARELAGTLSGGLRRRLELAKAMLHGPRLLVLDEPATGLDVAARQDMWRDLAQLRDDERVTVVLTTHLMEEADRCDRLAIMHEGRMAACGSPIDLKAAIGGEVLHIEAEASDKLADALRERFGVKVDIVVGGLHIETARAHRLIPDIIEAFPGQIDSVRLSRPSLEDVFFHATGRRFGRHGQTDIIAEAAE